MVGKLEQVLRDDSTTAFDDDDDDDWRLFCVLEDSGTHAVSSFLGFAFRRRRRRRFLLLRMMGFDFAERRGEPFSVETMGELFRAKLV